MLDYKTNGLQGYLEDYLSLSSDSSLVIIPMYIVQCNIYNEMSAHTICVFVYVELKLT